MPSGSHVLLIDDDPLVGESPSSYLNSVGYRCHWVRNGREGLREAREQRPDIVVTDIYMPEVEGMEVIMKLAESRPGLPVIAISGGGPDRWEGRLDAAQDFGAAATLSKPFTYDQLSRSIEDVLGRA